MIELLISRLEGVRQTGTDKYIALCPAHDDRSPSLSIRNVDDRLLIHCFAGCAAIDVVHALGLTMADLFAERGRLPCQACQARTGLQTTFPDVAALRLDYGDLRRGYSGGEKTKSGGCGNLSPRIRRVREIREDTAMTLVKKMGRELDDAQRKHDEQVFAELAKLEPAEYERVRKTKAKVLNIRTAVLDQEVNQRRRKDNGDAGITSSTGSLIDTDLANAQRLLQRHGQSMRWTKERGWLVFDGMRWVPDDAAAQRFAKDTGLSVFDEIKKLEV